MTWPSAIVSAAVVAAVADSSTVAVAVVGAVVAHTSPCDSRTAARHSRRQSNRMRCS